MKLGNLKIELENKIKEVMLEILKDFDRSKYNIIITLKDDSCTIQVKNKYDIFVNILYQNKKINMRTKNINSLIFECFKVDSNNYIESDVDLSEFIKFINRNSFQIMKKLHENKNLLETELKNILE